jgi:protein N-terminal methyltransferase
MQKSRSSSSAAAAQVRGSDADGTKYKDAEELWKQERSKGLEQNWYGSAISYWSSVPATVDGVLGGYGQVSPLDLTESASFLDALAAQGCSTSPGSDSSRAVDCGAGVGRITGGLLMQRFARVDVVEPVEHFLAQARADLGQRGHVGDFHLIGLESFDAPANTYDCVWVQWVIGHLVDDDMVAFLQVRACSPSALLQPFSRARAQRCRAMLKPHGVICVKENLSQEGFIVDREDSSLTRSDVHFKQVFARAGCTLLHEQLQQQFPKELFKVMMYALR